MNLRLNLVKSLMVYALMAAFIVLFVHPERAVNPYVAFAVIVTLDVLAYGAAMLLGNASGQPVIQIILSSVLIAGLLTFYMAPASALGFDSEFLALTIIQIMGLSAAYVLTRRGGSTRSKAPARRERATA